MISKLIILAAFSFSRILALQRKIRRLLSADGSKHSALNYLAFGEGLLSPVGSAHGAPRRGLGAHLSPVISVSASYKLHGRDTSIAKDLHGRLKSKLNNDFVQNLHLNRASATTETRVFAFLIIHSVARVACVCLAFVAVA